MDGSRTPAAPGAVLLAVVGRAQPQEESRSGTTGANGRVGEVVLRDAVVEAPADGAWRPGDDAPVRLVLLTGADRPDALVGVRTDSAARVELVADRDCDGTGERVDRIRLPAEGAVRDPGGVDTAYDLWNPAAWCCRPIRAGSCCSAATRRSSGRVRKSWWRARSALTRPRRASRGRPSPSPKRGPRRPDEPRPADGAAGRKVAARFFPAASGTRLITTKGDGAVEDRVRWR
ncbi:hypothetical protein ACFV4N_28850 [Actinosynnema sp. NPDC059797]